MDSNIHPVITRETLRQARLSADACQFPDGEDWGLLEGINYEETLRFTLEDSIEILEGLPQLRAAGLIAPESLISLGMVMGIRYANTIHKANISI